NPLRLRSQRKPQYESRQIRIHEDRTVSVQPIEGQKTALTRSHPLRLLLQQLVKRQTLFLGLPMISRRNPVFHKPREDVPDRRLTRFIAVIARNNPVLHNAAYSRHPFVLLAEQDIASGSAHDH